MATKYVTYSRYSSDLQSATSIPDQQRKCREFGQREGWSEVRAYEDAAVSGVGSDRRGFQRLLADACGLHRDFDVVLVDDTSRLSRSLPEIVTLHQRFAHYGVRVIAVSQGIDTQHEQSELLIAMHGISDSLYVKELAKKTHRGLESKFISGLSAGGRCFGYSTSEADGGKRWVVNEAEAVIVREIFNMSAEGSSLKRIAGVLNARKVPPPQKRKDRPHPTWCPTAIREILRRELYVGKRVWNQRKYVKTPGTNKRVARLRPQSEWQVQEVPDLRIVSEDLWARVQQRQETLKATYADSGRKPVSRASSSAYLFSGFLRCACCDANLIIVSGGKAGARYGCPQHWNRKSCSNNLTIKSSDVEARLLAGLQSQVLREEAVNAVVHGALRAAQQKEASDEREARIKDLEGEIRRLITVAAKLDDSEATVDEINQRQAELRALKAARASNTKLTEDDIRAFVQKALSDLPTLLKKAPEKAKAKLAEHMSPIRLLPQPDGTYVAEGEWDLLGDRGPVMVAGAGFEPATFGL